MVGEAETIERAALAAQHRCADAATRRDGGLRTVDIGDGMASIAGALPASAITVNRVVGLGLERPITAADIDAIVALYRDAGAARFFLNLHPAAASEAVAAILRAAGLAPSRGWQKFSRRLDDSLPAASHAFAVREIGEDHAHRFAEIVCAAFDLGEVAVPWLARVPGREGWRAYLAFDGDVAVGAGALFVAGEAVWTDFGATDPAHRGRGVQYAQLVHRLHAARALGCTRAYTCTGEAVPGDPQHSYANILRCGFREDYVRPNWAPATPTTS